MENQIVLGDNLREKAAKWMNFAVAEAETALAIGEVPVGAVFVKHQAKDPADLNSYDLENGDIVATGHNLTNETRNATQHAEYIALRNILETRPELAPSSLLLYVTVEPCVMCAYAMLLAGVKHVIFGASNERFGGCGSVLPVHQELGGLNCIKGVMAARAVELLKSFYEGENPNNPTPKRKKKDGPDTTTTGPVDS